MSPLLRKTVACILCCCMLLVMIPERSQAKIRVGVTIGVAQSVKEMLEDLIRTASAEVRAILEEAFDEISLLENRLTMDLKNIEDIAMDDLDRFASGLVSDVDDLLQSTMAQLMRSANYVDAAAARQVQDAIHQAVILWERVSKDLDRKMILVQQGVAVIIDAAMVQAARITLMIIAIMIMILGFLLLRRVTLKKIAICIGIFGAALLIFGLTPLFPRAVSALGRGGEKLPLDAPASPPEIFAIRPSASLEFRQQGDLEFLGLELNAAGGATKLLSGRSENTLREHTSAAVGPNKITIPLDDITSQSGVHFFRIDRADTQSTAIVVVYVREPAEIPVRINFSLWQRGTWSSHAINTLRIRNSQHIHKLINSTQRCYQSVLPVRDWEIKRFTSNVIDSKHCSNIRAWIESSALQLNVGYCLTSGPIWDDYSGKYNADYFAHLERSERGATEEMATRGDVVLYLNPATGVIHSRNTGPIIPYSGLPLYERRLGGRITAQPEQTPPAAQPRIPWYEVRRRVGMHPAMSPISPQKITSISGLHAPLQLPGHAFPPGWQLPLFPGGGSHANKFLLGRAPEVPGFAGDQTVYSALVVSSLINASALNKTGMTPVYNDRGILVLNFETDNRAQLWVTWLYVPQAP